MENNYAFIDGQNMYKDIRNQGWKVDYVRLRKYLCEIHNITKVYIFFGYLENQLKLYNYLTETDYCVIFKKISKDKYNNIKGNCDAELITRIGMEFWNFDKALIISGDGDYFSLVEILYELKKLKALLAPSLDVCSEQYFMLKKETELIFMSDIKEQVYLNEKVH